MRARGAVSGAIQRLERELGRLMLHRHGQQISVDLPLLAARAYPDARKISIAAGHTHGSGMTWTR
jgi:DNA-binding transcriptional LysR family regulator